MVVKQSLVNLNEQAFSRDKYIDKVENQAYQILDNCVLIIHCKYSDDNFKRNKNHWKGELKGICGPLTKNKLKVKNTFDNRLKLIKYALLDEIEILSPDTLKNTILDLNEKENTSIFITNKFFNQLKDVVVNLMELIARGDISSVNAYISKL